MSYQNLQEDERLISIVNNGVDANINLLLNRLTEAREQLKAFENLSTEISDLEKIIISLQDDKCLGVIPNTFVVCGEDPKSYGFCSKTCHLSYLLKQTSNYIPSDRKDLLQDVEFALNY